MTLHTRRLKTRRRSASVNLGVAAVVVATLSGCTGEEEYDYGAVCADLRSEVRVDDDACEDDSYLHGWYYIPVGAFAPGVRDRASGGSFTPPSSNAAVFRGGVPAGGATVARGGFGGSSDSFGG